MPDEPQTLGQNAPASVSLVSERSARFHRVWPSDRALGIRIPPAETARASCLKTSFQAALARSRPLLTVAAGVARRGFVSELRFPRFDFGLGTSLYALPTDDWSHSANPEVLL